jgi:plastocyanin
MPPAGNPEGMMDADAPMSTYGAADTVYAGIEGLEYRPNRFEIAPGTTIVWTNRDPLAHSITSDSGVWDSDLIQPDGTWSRTFTETGEFPFHCTPHPFMTGTVVVRGGEPGLMESVTAGRSPERPGGGSS